MKLLQLILFLLLASHSLAAVYYVRKDGNDANTGTSDTAGGAWLTLSKANTSVTAGDTINIGPGTWDENITIQSGGTNVNTPIVWNGAGKDVTTCSRFQNNQTSKTVGHPHVHFKNMTISWQIETMGHYNLIENCKFTWATYMQLRVNALPGYTGPDGVIVRTSDFIGVGAGGAISMNGNDGLIDRCFFTTQNGGDAMYLNGYRNIVRGNRFINWNRPAGSTQHTDLFQSFTNNGEISLDHIIENNFALNCDGTQIGNATDLKLLGMIGGWTFRNNIFIRVSNPLNLYIPNCTFYNNTFFETTYGAGSCVIVNASIDRGVANNTKFFNNIFYKAGLLPTSTIQGFYGIQLKGGATLSGFEANNNIVIGVGAGTVKAGSWTAYGANAGSLNGVDPLFVNGIDPTTPEEVRLLPNSPAINFGVNLSESFTTDFFGNTRTGGWTVGAIQFTSDTTPVDTTPPTVTSAEVNATGNQLTVNYSENVFNTAAAHYALTGTTLTNVTGSGNTRIFTCSPAIVAASSPILSYTSGSSRTIDSAGNQLATISGFVVTNKSLVPDTSNVPITGKRGVRRTNPSAFAR